MFLNDLGCACDASSLLGFSGALQLAPEEVLVRALAGEPYVAEPWHDLHMLVKAAYQRVCIDFHAVRACLDPALLAAFWRPREALQPWAALLQHARALRHAQLKALFRETVPG